MNNRIRNLISKQQSDCHVGCRDKGWGDGEGAAEWKWASSPSDVPTHTRRQAKGLREGSGKSWEEANSITSCLLESVTGWVLAPGVSISLNAPKLLSSV